jgi:uncharacterized protein YkwD
VTRQTGLVVGGVALLWVVPVLVFIAGTAALASGSGDLAAAAPEPAASACPHESDASAPPSVQEQAMLCLVDRARRGRGLSGFAAVAGLDRAARRKSADILRCDEFSHEACGRDFAYWIQRSGYFDPGCSGVAENIAWGTGNRATARSIFVAWMRSPGHRKNILGPYGLIGIGLRVGSLEGLRGAHVWTQEFARRDC